MATNGNGGGHRPAPTRQQPTSVNPTPPLNHKQPLSLSEFGLGVAAIFVVAAFVIGMVALFARTDADDPTSPLLGEKLWGGSFWGEDNIALAVLVGLLVAITLVIVAARLRRTTQHEWGIAFRKTWITVACLFLVTALAATAAVINGRYGWGWAVDGYNGVVSYLAHPTEYLYGGVAAGSVVLLVLVAGRVFAPRPTYRSNRTGVRVAFWVFVVAFAIAAGVGGYAVGVDVFNTLHAALTESDVARLLAEAVAEAKPAPSCTSDQAARLLAELGQIGRDFGPDSEAAQSARAAVEAACPNAPVPVD